MVSVARKNLFAEKTRLLISAGGVAFAVLLIMVIWGLFQGWNKNIIAYISSIDVDLWVAQEGSDNLFHGISLIPNSVESTLKDLPEVREVHRFLGRQVAFSLNGEEARTYLVGYDIKTGVGGPIKVVEGAFPPQKGQIIVDSVFARSKGIKLGDKLEILGRDFRVAGIAEGGNMFIYQFSFIRQDEAAELMQMERFTNYYLVRLAQGASIAAAAQRIEADVPGIAAIPKPKFLKTNRELIDTVFLPVIIMLAGIGFLVGVSVIGLTIYNATVEKSREYGVLKAVGASNWQLYRIIFEQAIVSGLIGYVLGVVLGYITTYIAQQVVAAFVTDTSLLDLVGMLALAIVMSVVASYIPVRRLVGIDPALVFKS